MRHHIGQPCPVKPTHAVFQQGEGLQGNGLVGGRIGRLLSLPLNAVLRVEQVAQFFAASALLLMCVATAVSSASTST